MEFQRTGMLMPEWKENSMKRKKKNKKGETPARKVGRFF